MTVVLRTVRRAFTTTRLRPPLTPRLLSTRAFPTIDHSQKIEEETLSSYRPINYYPARIGQVLNSQYQIITKFGYGVASTVWLCRDLHKQRYVVIKVFVRSSAYNKQAARELHAYERLCQTKTNHPGSAFIRKVFDSFEVEGPAGSHLCFVQEPLAMRLSELVPFLPNNRFSTEMLKPFCFYLLNTLDFLHNEAGLIHTDITASNILLENKDEDVLPDMEKTETEHLSERKVIDEQRTIYRSRRMPKPKSWGYPILCDFGEARFAERKYAEYIMPEIYRAPEVILEMEWDYKVDIWNFGVMIWDLYEGKHLFDSRTDENELSNIKHLSQIVAYLGPPPREFLEKDGSAFLFFDENGTLMDAEIPPLSFEAEEENLEGRDKELFLDFMRSMLCWLPEQRKTARELLEHPYMSQK